MISYYEPTFIEKFLWESGFFFPFFFQIFDKIQMTRNENWFHSETVEFLLVFYIFCLNMVVFGV